MMKSGLILFFIAIGIIGFGQGSSLSPYDLKEQYLEKANFFKINGSKAISQEGENELSRIVSLLEVNASDSYEYHFVQGTHLNFETKAEKELLAAKAIKPDASEVNIRLFEYYTCKGLENKAGGYTSSVAKYFSQSEFEYYEKVVGDKNSSFYVFSGRDDALPTYYLQLVKKKVGKDIVLINLDYLVDQAYREKVQTQLGMSNMNFLGNEKVFIQNMVLANPSIEFSTTIHQSYLSNIASQTYIVGLTYAYKVTNQKERLEKFWVYTKANYNSFSLDNRKEKKLYSNYLPPLLTLYKLKITEGEKDQLLKQGIELLAKKIGREREVETILKRYG